MEFRYVQNIDSDEPVMLINKHIGNDDEDGPGIDGSLFQEELMALDGMGKKRIQVWINSVGGIVMDGYNICSAILKTKTPVDTYCMGMAASIAGVIFQCGRKRIMADYGILMYHNPYAGETTTSPLLDNMKDSLNTLIRNKCGMSEDAVHRMMDRTSFIQADEAVQMKLCDTVEHTVKLNSKYLPRTTNDGRRYYEAAGRVLNKLFDNQTPQKMLKVTNRLKLTDDANEDSILSAIEGIENRAIAAEDALTVANKKSSEELDAMNGKIKDAEDALAAMKKQYEECKAELDLEVEAKNKIAEEALDAKVVELVENAVKMGKIKNEATVIDGWKAQAKANFDGTKAMIDGIATNKKAERFVIASKENESASKYPSVGQAMAKLSLEIDKKK
jgi:ATP-dependent Clp protease protease subunit